MLVPLNLTANIADAILANILSPTSHIKGITELVLRACLLLWIFVLIDWMCSASLLGENSGLLS
ncbi:MAG: hypothetical protein BMS9Abin08_0567 [Gammaproteobacteria bacterium]|nr:MAG: hypothetical protein BMS9Abin08_0567 [Gammaproteobacteria bacterium]